MDDLTITAKTVIEGRWVLEEIEDLSDWAQMEFKPKNLGSRSRATSFQKRVRVQSSA